MRICIYGAGASGGHFAAKLAKAGHAVSVVVRGPHLEAIRRNGIQLRMGDQEIIAKVEADDRPAALGVQDYVIIATKATGLAPIAGQLGPLVGSQTIVAFVQNGIPWWYPCALPADKPKPPELPIFRLADRFLASMRIDQIAGGVIYSANEIEAPGIIKNNSLARNRLDFAPIDGHETAAHAQLRDALERASILSPPVPDIRLAVWAKLIANISGTIIALVTGNQASISRKDPALGEIYLRIGQEGMAVAAAHGYALDGKIDLLKARATLFDHKPSLLQDIEQGRPMEIGEMVLAPVAFARAAGLATPTLDALAAIAARLAIDRGLYFPS